ncbi:AIR synthase-related protein [Pseudobacter ginsenosidimutans]|uniref:Hydrogenase maturation factor n=1 Tax=Pseudobacter ginsenosidimutans TaxID=661488 RepID=A0A4Q7MX38_9BACT|nr:AIR synthase-related protein [Pseudobacter ginsenosidimutans]QEC41465.1 AIR synthase [Pseudobacter ginsenosidimutans]RZS71753.1 hydrogenase maturation factor [Pseudobacter ginsenosidimutans]
MSAFVESGKLHMDLFNRLIYPLRGAENKMVSTGPEYGVDVSIVDLPGGYSMALTSDPLSWIPTLGLRESAWLSVHLMANDIATTSQPPQFAQLVLNLPESASSAEFEEYWMFVHQYCKDIGVAITGGHTGKAAGQHSTIAGGGTMISIAPAGKMLLSKYARPGDLIMITKEAAQIASSILALSFPETVKKNCGKEIWEKAAGLFQETSSLQAGLCAASLPVTAMHDVTEGGLLGAIYEMAIAADCGAIIDSEELPVGTAQQAVCDLFAIDPLRCIGAGSMIMAVNPEHEATVLHQFALEKIKVSVVGEFTAEEQGIRLQKDDGIETLSRPGSDPYWNAFFQALKNEWK